MDTESRTSRTSGVSRLQSTQETGARSSNSVVDVLRRKVPLFALLDLVDGAQEPPFLVVLGLVIYVMQQLAWTVNTQYSAAWGYVLGSDTSRALYASHIAIWDSSFVSNATLATTHGLLWPLVALAVALLTLLACLRFFIDPSERQSKVLVFLVRMACRGISTWLLIPAGHALIGPLVCNPNGNVWFYGNNFSRNAAQCWSTEHTIIFIACILTAVVLGTLAYFILCCDFTEVPLSPHLKARAQSLADRLYFAHVTISLVLFHVLMAYDQKPLFAVIHGMSSLLFGLAVGYLFPFHRAEVNSLVATTHVADAFLSFVAAAGGWAPMFALSNFTSVLGLGCLPAVAAIAFALVDSRVAEQFRQALRNCTGRGRKRLPSDEEQPAPSLGSLPYPAGLYIDQWSELRDITAVIMMSEDRGDDEGGGGGNRIGNNFGLNVGRAGQGITELLVPYLNAVYIDTDVEVSTRFVPQFSLKFSVVPTVTMIAHAAKIFVRGLVTFPRSTILRIQLANFVWQFHPTLCQTGLNEIEKVRDYDTSIDQRYLSERVEQRVRYSLGMRGKNATMGFKLTEAHHIRTLTSIAAFWVKLTETNVDLRELGEIADKVTKSRDDAITSFRRSIQNQTANDLNLVNRLGMFLEDILMDMEGAAQCRSEAKDIQESRSSRQIRGARKATSSEVDPATLSSRLLQLLSGDGKATRTLTGRGRGARALATQIAGICVVLLIVIGIALGFSVAATDNARAASNKLTHGGALRYLPEQFVGVLYSYEAEFANSTAQSAEHARLSSLLKDFSSAFEEVAHGSAVVTDAKHQTYFNTKTAMVYDVSFHVSVVTPWELAEMFHSAMATIVLQNASDSLASRFLKINLLSFVAAFDVSMELYSASIADDFQLQATKNLILFGIALLAALALYATIVLNFQRTAQGRIFAFQLFTLIPFDDLQLLATEARRKASTINKEREDKESSARYLDESSMNAASAGGATAAVATNQNREDAVKSDEKAARSSGSISLLADDLRKMSILPGGAPKWMQTVGLNIAAIVVRSCVKGSRDKPLPTTKKVVVTNEVESFQEAAEEEGGAQQVANADEADTLMLEEETGPATPSRTAARETHWGAPAIYAVLAIIVVGLSATVCGLAATSPNEETFAQSIDTEALNSMYNFQEYVNSLMRNVMSTCYNPSSDTVQAVLADLRSGATEKLTDVAIRSRSKTTSAQVAEVLQRNEYLRARVYDFLALAIFTDEVGMIAQQTKTALDLFLAKRPVAEIEKEHVDLLPAYINKSDSQQVARWIAWYHCDEDIPELWQLMQDPLDSLQSLYTSVSPKTTAPVGLYIVTAALLCVAAVALGFRYVHGDSLASFGDATWITFAASMVLSVVLLILLSVWDSRRVELLSTKQSLDQVGESHHEALTSLTQIINNERHFVASGEVAFWLAAKDFTMELETRTLRRYDAFPVDDVEAFVAALYKVSHFHAIASSLTMQRYNSSVHLEPEMREAFATTSWNYREESDYEKEITRFPPETRAGFQHYSNTTYDLSQNDTVLERIARDTVYSKQYQSWTTELATRIGAFTNVSLERWTQTHQRAKTQSQAVRYAVLVVSIVIAATAVGALIGLATPAMELLGLRGSGSGNQTSAAGEMRHANLLHRARILLVLITGVVIACLIVGSVSPLSVTSYYRRTAAASHLTTVIGETFVHVQEVLHPELNPRLYVAESLVSLGRSSEQLSESIRTLFFGESLTDGEFNAFGQDPDFDSIMWGGTDWKEKAIIAARYTAVPCVDTSKQISASSGETIVPRLYGSSDIPLMQAMSLWQLLLKEVRGPETAGHSNTAVEGLRSIETTLFPSLNQAIREYAEFSMNRQTSLIMQFSIVVALLIVILIVASIAVFFPVVAVLVEDDAATWHLIAMIPHNVRESVPAIADFIETGRADSAAELQRKIEQSEKLLKNILPTKIANRLKSGEQPIADMHMSVTMCFTDLVGFTATSHTMNAVEIVSFLNELFVEFDTIAELFEIEKIKTIGDAYFMVGGLDGRITDHAVRVVEAALAFFESMSEHNERHPERKPLRMRLGIHTGPAVAGVIGTKKVAYDLWGRSVEIANAMESTGIPSKIHVSETALRDVQQYFHSVPRGPLPTEKGVPDNMPNTFILTGRAAPTMYQFRRRPRMNKHVPPPTTAAPPAATGAATH